MFIEASGFSYSVGIDLIIKQMHQLGVYISVLTNPETPLLSAEPLFVVVKGQSMVQLVRNAVRRA